MVCLCSSVCCYGVESCNMSSYLYVCMFQWRESGRFYPQLYYKVALKSELIVRLHVKFVTLQSNATCKKNKHLLV